MYDDNNIFAKIFRKEIPCDSIFEDEKVIFFHDIRPQAKIHILGIPKVAVINLSDFIQKCGKEEVFYFFQKIYDVVNKFDLQKTGYRLITNEGADSNQAVPHW
jgi:diadenosine tetraphosphate (Ap4A) HIT family hydrolase